MAARAGGRSRYDLFAAPSADAPHGRQGALTARPGRRYYFHKRSGIRNRPLIEENNVLKANLNMKILNNVHVTEQIPLPLSRKGKKPTCVHVGRTRPVPPHLTPPRPSRRVVLALVFELPHPALVHSALWMLPATAHQKALASVEDDLDRFRQKYRYTSQLL
ncbi:hypothetical protein EVAR_103992_1 [Eumeta japonica]|uniref:Uncharacterized protein n=1 Tax=Eumeta variegata TaxID=151549 RepID=A0A4C1XZP1_EUMVA|nr:hypothetical protein EVAR_103992_1 [Eumeta japonica]